MHLGGGFAPDVIEPGVAFDRAYQRMGIRKVGRTFEEMSDSFGYQVVHASHWLEHMIDVRLVFRRFRKLLAADGIGFIEVPNCEDPYWDYRYFPDPPHLQYFTPASLRTLAQSQGFRVLEVQTVGMPLALEKGIGYLEAGTETLISRVEHKRLMRQRSERVAALKRRLGRRAVGAWNDPGPQRANLRLVFEHAAVA
jgi:hypothetical protein